MKQSIKPIRDKAIIVFNMAARRYCGWLRNILTANVYFGRNIAAVPANSVVFFPYRQNLLCCGIAAIVSYKFNKSSNSRVETAALEDSLAKIEQSGCETCKKNDYADIDLHYLGGKSQIDSLWQAIQNLKCKNQFYAIFTNTNQRRHLTDLGERLTAIINAEAKLLSERMGHIPAQSLELMTTRIEKLKDMTWCIHREIINNIDKIKGLSPDLNQSSTPETVNIFKKINAVLNSLDRLEVRGRDSAGISLMFVLNKAEFEKFEKTLERAKLYTLMEERLNRA